MVTDSVSHYKLSLTADYYPFGMLMPGRYVSDTSTHCVTVLQQKWLWRWVTVSCWDQTNWVWPGYTGIGNGQAVLYDENIEITASKDLDGVSFTLPVTAGVDHQLTLELSLLENTGTGTSVQVRAFQNDEWEILASSELRMGMQFLKFTPSVATQVELVFVGPVHTSVVQMCLEKWTLVQDQVLVDVCDGDKDRYRFGFNGMLKDNELKGIGNSLDFGARIYDSRIGRFLSLDPLAKKYPSESNYTFAGNSPIYLIDKGGNYKVPAANEEAYNKTYPLIMKYLSTQVESDISNSTKIINGLISTNPNITSNTVKGISKWGFGPEVVFKDAPGEFPMEFKGAAGYTEKDGHVIQMNAGYAKYVEKVLASDASPKVKQAAFMRFYMTLVHETGHELNKYGKSMGQNAQGHDTYQSLPKGRSSDEQGLKAEENIWGTDKYKPFSSPSLDDSEGEQGISSEKYKKGVTEGVINEANKTEEGRKSLPTVPTQ